MDISWMPKKLQKKFEGKGLGDIVKESIDTVSAGKIKQCGACKKRQERMNNWMQFEKKNPVEETSEPKKKGKVDRIVGVLEKLSDKLDK